VKRCRYRVKTNNIAFLGRFFRIRLVIRSWLGAFLIGSLLIMKIISIVAGKDIGRSWFITFSIVRSVHYHVFRCVV